MLPCTYVLDLSEIGNVTRSNFGVESKTKSFEQKESNADNDDFVIVESAKDETNSGQVLERGVNEWENYQLIQKTKRAKFRGPTLFICENKLPHYFRYCLRDVDTVGTIDIDENINAEIHNQLAHPEFKLSFQMPNTLRF